MSRILRRTPRVPRRCRSSTFTSTSSRSRQFKPHARELIKRGRRDYDEVVKYTSSPKEFLKFLDAADIERAGLINYVSPDVIGFTPDVNDWIAKYCAAEPRACSLSVRCIRSMFPIRARKSNA